MRESRGDFKGLRLHCIFADSWNPLDQYTSLAPTKMHISVVLSIIVHHCTTVTSPKHAGRKAV